jgi:penicillin-binding protein 1C
MLWLFCFKLATLKTMHAIGLWWFALPRLMRIFYSFLTGIALLFIVLPPDTRRYDTASRLVLASNGTTLRTYLTPDGMVRLQTSVTSVSPAYLKLLIAYEDQRFFQHTGVDAAAVLRAAGQALHAGRIVSGGSTLTMQVVRLLEPRPRTVLAKVIEMFRALQLESRYSKSEILNMYLTLAPMGGNLEGVSAASKSYFNKNPHKITLSEATTLIALPQSPTRLRKNPAALASARNKILAIAAARAGLPAADVQAALRTPVKLRDVPLGFSAPLLADRLMKQSRQHTISSTIDAQLQAGLERKTIAWSRTIDPQASLAILVVDIKTRAVKAYVGSVQFTATARAGQVDAVTAVRSPGSALKPFIYARAFDEGLAHPMTLVDDVETRFGVYAPANFEDQYHGRVTLADALRLSLNVPAVLLLDRIGPVNFTEQMRARGLPLQLPKGAKPGLPIALGGVGVTLEDMAAAYAALGDDGKIHPLVFSPTAAKTETQPDPFADDQARRWTADILRGAPPPDGVPAASTAARSISLKTGTSYGYRDAWAFGFDARHVVAVWTGRPDGTPSPGRFGVNTAAPILFDVFDLTGVRPRTGTPDIGMGTPLSPRMAALGPGNSPQRAFKIAHPVDGSALPYIAGKGLPLEVRGGKAPYLWIANGTAVGEARPGQSVMWTPDGPGFHTLTVVDATGRSAAARIRIRQDMSFAQE